MKKMKYYFLILLGVFSLGKAQYQPMNWNEEKEKEAQLWVKKTYDELSLDEKLGQLFILALYTNKGQEHIEEVRKMVKEEKIGGLILMQEDIHQHIKLVNEFNRISKIPLLVGMDAEWGVFQRINTAYKYPWAMPQGAIQNKNVIKEMATQIAKDCYRVGVRWNFAPVVDVNTNAKNPIIGNRSFGSNVKNVVASAWAYVQGLEQNGVLSAIKHFPGHGDTSVDSHYDLPVVKHPKKRLEKIEIAPFKQLINKGVGGVMVAHLYVPALAGEKSLPASISKEVVTRYLKNQLNYKGLIITDALNMGAVAKNYPDGELDAMAFEAGNDLMLFSQAVHKGKNYIKKAINDGKIPISRVEESVKKILLNKYYLGLHQLDLIDENSVELSTPYHQKIVEKVYENALTLIQNKKKNLPLSKQKTYYYLPLEEGNFDFFQKKLEEKYKIIVKKNTEINSIPEGETIIIGLHKDNSTAYKPYEISKESKEILEKLKIKNNVILLNFASPYALKNIEISKISTILIAYENNQDAMNAVIKALGLENSISGKLPVEVNQKLKYGKGIFLPSKK